MMRPAIHRHRYNLHNFGLTAASSEVDIVEALKRFPDAPEDLANCVRDLLSRKASYIEVITKALPRARDFWETYAAELGELMVVSECTLGVARGAPYYRGARNHKLEVGCLLLDLGGVGLQTAVLWPNGRAGVYNDNGREPYRWVKATNGEIFLIEQYGGEVYDIYGEYVDEYNHSTALC